MLKKKIGTLGLVAVMMTSLLPCISVHAEESVKVTKTEVIINENFDNYEASSTALSTDVQTLAFNENISLKKYYAWNYDSVATISNVGKDSTNAMTVDINDGGTIKFVNPDGTTPIAEGDVIHINFDTKYSASSNAFMRVNINDNKSARYSISEYTSWTDNILGLPQFLNMHYVDEKIAPSDNSYGGVSFKPNTWVNVDIVLNTAGTYVTSAGKEIIRPMAKITVGNDYWYGRYDANYTGTDDKTYENFTEFTSLSFDTTKERYGDTEVLFDNVKVEITKQVEEEVGGDDDDTNQDQPAEGMIISENFNNYATSSTLLTKNFQTLAANENISYKKYYTWNAERAAAITSAGKDSTNALKINISDGGVIKFANPNGTTPLAAGDLIHINFDTTYSQGDVNSLMKLNINENASAKYNIRDYTSWTNNFSGLPQFLKMDYVNKVIVPSDEVYGGVSFKNNTWTNVDVLINTADEDNNGKQTVKITVGDDYWYGVYDADYTGSGDTTTDAFAEFTSLTFDSTKDYYGNTDVTLDNVMVEIVKKETEEEEIIKESVVKKTLLDENFDSYAISSTSLTKSFQTLADNENIIYKRYYEWNGAAAGITADGKDSTNAIEINVNDGGVIEFVNPAGTTPIDTGDIIHISFDTKYSKGDNISAMKFNINGNTARCAGIGDGYFSTWVEGFKGLPQILRMDYVYGGILASDNVYEGMNGIVAFEPNTWTNVDVVINTSDKSRNNGRQSVKVTIGDEYWYGTYDANYTGDDDKTYDKITEFTSLTFDTTKNQYGNTDVTFDNVKVEVIKPGFGISGTAVEGCDEGKFKNGQIELEAAINSAYANTVEQVSLFVAQYGNNGRLLEIQSVPAQTKDGYCIINTTEAITINNEAQTVKILVFNSGYLLPYLDAKVLTRAE